MEQNYYGYIYITIDQKHNKVYVGQKKGKIEDSENYYGSGTRIPLIIKKRGDYFLEKRILGVCCSPEELTEQETECKLFFHALDRKYGYNIILEDYSPMTGRKHKEESKRKIKEKRKNQIFTKETRKKLSDAHIGRSSWNKGIPISIETKQKISNTMKGIDVFWLKDKPLSKEHKQKISENAKNNPNYGMKNKKFFDIWVKKYGIEIANKKEKERINNFKNSYQNRTEKDKELTSKKMSESHLGSKNHKYRIDLDDNFEKIKELKNNNVSSKEIAKLFKCSVSTINRRFRNKGE